jgi:hypothetical protein
MVDPFAIDYLITSGEHEGKVQRRIMRWEGQNVTFCFAEPGTPGPFEFSTPVGGGHTITTWNDSLS